MNERDDRRSHELSDAELVRDAEERRDETSRRGRLGAIAAVVVLLVLGVVGYFVFLAPDGERRAESRDERPAPTGEEVPSEVDPGDEEPALTEDRADDDAARLATPADRDESVRRRLDELGGGALPQSVLGVDDLTRRLVAAIDGVARGGSISSLFPGVRPDAAFEAVERDGELYPAPSSYHRFDRWLGILASIDPAAAAGVFDRLEPLLQAAYRDLGYPEGEVEAALRSAVGRLLATPVPDSPPRLVPAGARGYAFADPSLERLAPAQKQLLRMGPENQRRVVSWLERFDAAL